MKKLAIILVGIFVLGQSFMMADEIESPESLQLLIPVGFQEKEVQLKKECEQEKGTRVYVNRSHGFQHGTCEKNLIKITEQSNSNKTTIISILVVIIGIGLVITALRLRKLNQKNENPLPPQQ